MRDCTCEGEEKGRVAEKEMTEDWAEFSRSWTNNAQMEMTTRRGNVCKESKVNAGGIYHHLHRRCRPTSSIVSPQ